MPARRKDDDVGRKHRAVGEFDAFLSEPTDVALYGARLSPVDDVVEIAAHADLFDA